jgi:hypothetical protein
VWQPGVSDAATFNLNALSFNGSRAGNGFENTCFNSPEAHAAPATLFVLTNLFAGAGCALWHL